MHVVNQSSLIQRSSKSLTSTLKFLYSAKTEAQSHSVAHITAKKVDKQIKLINKVIKGALYKSFHTERMAGDYICILYVVIAKVLLRCVISVNKCKNKSKS